jgi:hypothetical protein
MDFVKFILSNHIMLTNVFSILLIILDTFKNIINGILKIITIVLKFTLNIIIILLNLLIDLLKGFFKIFIIILNLFIYLFKCLVQLLIIVLNFFLKILIMFLKLFIDFLKETQFFLRLGLPYISKFIFYLFILFYDYLIIILNLSIHLKALLFKHLIFKLKKILIIFNQYLFNVIIYLKICIFFIISSAFKNCVNFRLFIDDILILIKYFNKIRRQKVNKKETSNNDFDEINNNNYDVSDIHTYELSKNNLFYFFLC